MSRTKRVLAFGWYGAGNLGDELLLDTLKRWCAERDSRVTAISIDPAYTSDLHDIDAVDYHDLPGVARAMRSADLFVLGGGGLFQTYHSLSIAGLYDFTAHDIATYARPVLMARQMRVPTLAWAQGIGPLAGDEAREVVRDVFGQIDHLSVRDEASQRLLVAMGVEREVVVAPDPVWACALPAAHAENGGGRPRRIGIALREWTFQKGWEDHFIESLKAAIGTENATLVWLPFQPRAVPGRSPSDLDFTRSLMERFDGYAQELVEFAGLEDAIEVLAGCDAIVAMRLHAQILALRLGKHTLCIEYDAKMASASEQAGVLTANRLAIDATADAWSRTLAHWWLSLDSSPASSNAGQLESEAFAHRALLHAALEATDEPRPSRWDSADFDWLSAWQQKVNDAALVNRDRMLLRLDNLLTDLQGSVAGLTSQLAERDGYAAHLEDQLAAQKNQLATQDERLSELHGQLTAQTNELLARGARITELDTQIVDKTALLEQREMQAALLIEAQGERIRQMDTKLTDATGQVAVLNNILGQRSAEISRLQARLENLDQLLAEAREEVVAKQEEVNDLRGSTSWRITRPIRFVRYFLRNPAHALRETRKLLLPAPTAAEQQVDQQAEQQLEPLTGPFTNLLVSDAQPAPVNRDLSWEEFHALVLSRREEFKGIFVQEITIDWNVPLYQRPQHLATAFARLGYLVIYKLAGWSGEDVDGFRQVADNVWLTKGWEIDFVDGAVRSVYSTAYGLEAEELNKRPPGNVMVYEYIDHIDPLISGDAENIRRLLDLREWAFSGGADFVIASARLLEREACDAIGRDKVILVQNGVDTRHYRNRAHDCVELPERLHDFRKRYANIVGYFGAIAPWLWYEALHELVSTRPDLGFVFIGPDYFGGVERLPVADNVLNLGPIDYQVLPAYASNFDICFIPFEPGDIARTTSPLKLFEYFALEKPVVVTSEMLECVAHPEVFAGDSAAALSLAIDQAISVKSDPAFKARMATLADENDWDCRARAMEAAFAALPSKLVTADEGG